MKARCYSLHQPRWINQAKIPHEYDWRAKEGSGIKQRLSVRAGAEMAEGGTCCSREKKEKRTKSLPELDAVSTYPTLSACLSAAVCPPGCGVRLRGRRRVSPAEERAFRSQRIHSKSSPLILNLPLTFLRTDVVVGMSKSRAALLFYDFGKMILVLVGLNKRLRRNKFMQKRPRII